MSDELFDGLTDLEELGREQDAIEVGADPLAGEWRRLLEISTRITAELEIETLLGAVMDAAVEITGAEHGFVILLDEKDKPLVRIAHNLKKEEIQDIQGSISKTIIEKISSERKPMLINDVDHNELLSHQVSVRNLHLKSVMGAPIECKDRLLGMAYVDNSSLTGVFSQREFAIFVTFVNLAAVAIHNANLFESLWKSNEQNRLLQEYNENILRTVPSGLIVLNSDKEIEYFNPAMQKIFKTIANANDPIKKRIPHDEILRNIQQLKPDYNPPVLLLEIENRNYEVSFFSVLKHENKVGILIADVTALKRLEKQYYEEEKRALITQLSGGIAHEISNQLFPIQGRAQLTTMKLQKQYPNLDPEIFQALTVIEDQVRKIARITDDLRHLSKPAEPKLTEVNLTEVLREAMDVMSTTAGKIKHFKPNDPKAQYQLKSSYHQKELIVEGDSNQLQQMFMNLIINAAHAIEVVKKGTLSVGTELRKDQALAFIEDTGTGIPDEILDKIFEPYFTTKEEGKGTGLGMPIVKNIVEAHKGKLTLKTKVGKGTRIEIIIPLKKNKKN